MANPKEFYHLTMVETKWIRLALQVSALHRFCSKGRYYATAIVKNKLALFVSIN